MVRPLRHHRAAPPARRRGARRPGSGVRDQQHVPGAGRVLPVVETSVYCDPSATGGGLGTALYATLFSVLAGEDLHRAYAGVALPNDASESLHRRFGFREIGTYTEVGRKFGQWWDVRWYERPMP